MNENGDTNLNWVYFIRAILNECEFTYIWETENVNNKEWLKCVVKQRSVCTELANISVRFFKSIKL